MPWLTTSSQHLSLSPIHIFLAVALPAEWGVPEKLSHPLRAVLLWQIWKDQNGHYMAGRPSIVQHITREACHRLCVIISMQRMAASPLESEERNIIALFYLPQRLNAGCVLNLAVILHFGIFMALSCRCHGSSRPHLTLLAKLLFRWHYPIPLIS